MYRRFAAVTLFIIVLLSAPSRIFARWMAIPNDGQDYTGRTVVITGDPYGPVFQHCGLRVLNIPVVILDAGPGGSPPMILAAAIQESEGPPVPGIWPGQRFTVHSQIPCEGALELFLTGVPRGDGIGVALVTAPPAVTLTTDHKAVATADTDQSGIAEVVCVTKGAPPLTTELLSDVPLVAGDWLTGFVELDHDTDTGETLYGCWVEY